MARITVLGGTGYGGAAIVAEAAKRGHDVTSVSRSEPGSRVAGVEYVTGSVLNPVLLDAVLPGRDVVFSALSPRGDMAGKIEGVLEELIGKLAGTTTRLGYLGGASSLHVEEGGPRLWDLSHDKLPPEVKAEIETGMRALEMLQASPADLDWFYVSPPADFGARLGTAPRGTYRLGGDILVKDDEGASRIAAADLALAIVDEIESPAHHRRRFTAAY